MFKRHIQFLQEDEGYFFVEKLYICMLGFSDAEYEALCQKAEKFAIELSKNNNKSAIKKSLTLITPHDSAHELSTFVKQLLPKGEWTCVHNARKTGINCAGLYTFIERT